MGSGEGSDVGSRELPGVAVAGTEIVAGVESRSTTCDAMFLSESSALDWLLHPEISPRRQKSKRTQISFLFKKKHLPS